MYRCDFNDDLPLNLHPAGLKLRPFGCLVLAHTAFCIGFAYLPIRAGLESMDFTLERATADL